MVWLALLIGCFPDSPGTSANSCVGCHGSAETGPAPPTALGGFSERTYMGVGAHQAHVDGLKLQAPVACGECHLVPPVLGAPGHVDTDWPAEVGWGELAKTDAGFTAWDRELGTCTVYCHGATLTGGLLTEPDWTATDGEASNCGACHGNPPPLPHPPSAVCADCHGASTPDTHIDGLITWHTDTTTGATTTTGDTGTPTGTTTVPAGCDTCHGAAGNAAPPPDLLGSVDTRDRGVGAHAIHVSGGANSAPVPCATCHVVPGAVGDVGHIDTAPAEVVFSLRAEADGAVPNWDPVTLSCEAYCHGATLGGGSNTEPLWDVVDGSQANCGACHSIPPPFSHPQNNNCDQCHAPISATTHINGVVDF